MWWTIPGSVVGAAVYMLMDCLTEPLFVRLVWGLTAGGIVMLIGLVR